MALGSGCTAPPDEAEPPPPVDDDAAEGDATTPEGSDAPQPLATPARCADEDRTAMSDAVSDQLAAIAERDWTTALGYTSSTFRDEVDAAAFERIIVDGFPVVAAAVASDTTSCLLADDGLASLLVTVEDGDGTQQDLVYLFELEDRRWRISGALPDEDGPREGDEPTITT